MKKCFPERVEIHIALNINHFRMERDRVRDVAEATARSGQNSDAVCLSKHIVRTLGEGLRKNVR